MGQMEPDKNSAANLTYNFCDISGAFAKIAKSDY
jgi:hypothetical protein